MPTVKLSKYECSRDLLPAVCAFCGAPAGGFRERKFSWHPGWVWVLILVHVIVLIIVAVILTKRMVVRVPVCDQRSGYWSRRTGILTDTFLVIAAFAVVALFYLSNQPPGPRDDLVGWLCGGGFILFFVWLIFAAIYSSRGVRPIEITDRFIRLAGVHEEFVAALEADRDRDADERDRRVRYGDVRDDYDDAPELPPPRSRDRDDYDDYEGRPSRRYPDDR
jgi:uncharacterized membrane protein SirB2